MSKATAKWKGNDAIILEAYDATEVLNTPFTVILKCSAKQVLDDAGNVVETIIPDPEGLVKAVAQARVLHAHKLNGAELKFLRSALGLKSKELGKAIAVTPEHMSRLEAGDKVMSPQSEMLVRIFTYVSTLPFTIRKEEEALKIATQVGNVFGGLSIKSCYAAEEKITLTLVRVPRDCPADDSDFENGLWDEPADAVAA
jgi:transcriptional regulator with XRE-family HTH domain